MESYNLSGFFHRPSNNLWKTTEAQQENAAYLLTITEELYYTFLRKNGADTERVGGMKISAALLYHYLSERYPVSRYGRGFHGAELPLPAFYQRGAPLEYGRLYIARTQDLPQLSHTDCLFLCVGSRPANVWSYWQGEVYYVAEPQADVFTLFNFVNGFFDRVSRWDQKMRDLLDSRADIEEFVRASIPLFENSITITDYDLRVLVDCIDVEHDGKRRIVINKQFSRVPNDVSERLADNYASNVRRREPFFYKGQREDPSGLNYCINLYQGDSYIGSCSIRNRLHDLHESDCLLFQQFAEYIRRFFSLQSRASAGQPITIKAIFSDLLQCFPVSREDLDWAMELLHRNLELQGAHFDAWQCIVIRSANRGKTLPEGYLCATLEGFLPRCTAVTHDDLLVCFRVLTQEAEDDLGGILAPYLQNMNFRAAVSAPFQDIFKARDRYLQACAILESGSRHAPGQLVYAAEDFILPYMLEHCTGGFDAENVLMPGVRRLRELESGIDYWDTLRRYLDNECNASKTAQELHLHRSSLLPRLEKIKSVVPLDTPAQRLYLRLCIALCAQLAQDKGAQT